MPVYEFAPVTARCPICSNDSSKRLWQLNASYAAQHFVRKDVDPERNAQLYKEIVRIWGKDTCEMVQCDKCSFVFAHPFVGGGADFYGTLLESPSYPSDRFEFGKSIEALRARRGVAADGAQRPRLLEVGAGDGAFVRRLTGDLFDPQDIVCTEFSEAGLQAIQRLGIKCIKKDVRALPEDVQNMRFTAVAMFQVLEHLDGLDELWNAFNKITAPGADLFLSVPNDKWLEFQEQNTGLYDMPPGHVGRWNRGAFSEIGKRHGWKLVDYAIEPATRVSVWNNAAMARFCTARQKQGSLTDRTTRINNRTLRRICSIPLLSAWYLWAAPLAARTPATNLGGTQWAHLRKDATTD